MKNNSNSRASGRYAPIKPKLQTTGYLFQFKIGLFKFLLVGTKGRPDALLLVNQFSVSINPSVMLQVADRDI